jgi:hypothetical protein
MSDVPPAPPPFPPYGQYAGPPGYQPPESNKKALWSLILGIVGLVCCGFAAIAAIVLANQARNEIRMSGGAQTGGGQAQAGLILGIVGCALWALGLVFYLIVGIATSSTS